jgi:hypothetical protein
MHTLVLTLALTLGASDAAHDKYFDDERVTDDAMKELLAGGKYAEAASKARTFVGDHQKTAPADVRGHLDTYAEEATELDGWAKLSAKSRDAASLKALVVGLAQPKSYGLREQNPLSAGSTSLFAALRTADPMLGKALSRKVKVTVESQGLEAEVANLLTDAVVAELKGAGVAASGSEGEDVFAVVASGCAEVKGSKSSLMGADMIQACRSTASARWLHGKELVLGGINLSGTTAGFSAPSPDRAAQRIAARVPSAILLSWAGVR